MQIMNPTTEVLENRVSEMEFDWRASFFIRYGSGYCGVLNITSSGDNIVSDSIYQRNNDLLKDTFPKMGIEARFGNVKDIDGLEKMIDEKTKLIFCESIGNPAANVTDAKRNFRYCAPT